jgi:arsenate reductase
MGALVIVYEKPTCSKCRRLVQLLDERGVEYTRVDFHKKRLSEEKLRELLAKAGLGPRDVLRRREPTYMNLRIRESETSDDALIALMVEHPELLQRPLVEHGERAVLARPVEKALSLLDG